MHAEPADRHFSGCGSAAVQIDVVADLREIGPAVDAAMRAASSVAGRADPAIADEFRLALTEALNNVVEHACHPSGVPIFMTVGGRTGVVWVCIQDRGMPLPASVLTDGEMPAVPEIGSSSDLDLLPDGGWGWMLIKASVDRVRHRRIDDCNLLLLERQLAPDQTRQNA